MSNSNSASLRVLIIDDHRTMRLIIRQLLGRVSINDIAEAENGEMAMAMLNAPASTMPDVIICDLHMDKMDGMEFCNRLRRSDDDRHRGIPILILTGEEDEMLHAVSRQIGRAHV